MRSIYGAFAIKYKHIKDSSYVFITKELSEEVRDIYRGYGSLFDNVNIKKGIWIIEKFQEVVLGIDLLSPIPLDCLQLKLRLIGSVDTLHIYYTKENQVIFDSCITTNTLRPYFKDTKALDKYNNKEFLCVACDNKLNILSINLRVCNSCEKIMNEK